MDERAVGAKFRMAVYVMLGSLERLEPAGRNWEAGQFLVPVSNNKGWNSGYESGVKKQEVNLGAILETDSNVGVHGFRSRWH